MTACHTRFDIVRISVLNAVKETLVIVSATKFPLLFKAILKSFANH